MISSRREEEKRQKMSDKTVLLFTWHPVPSETNKIVEGSSLRFWRMALALKEKGIGAITIAVWHEFQPRTDLINGIKVVPFDGGPDNLAKLIKDFDSIIFSCALGDLSRLIYEAANDQTQIIVDAYSPMYVEFLTKSLGRARDQQFLENYLDHTEVFNRCLADADYVLFANENQKHLFRGVLASMGELMNYDEKKFIYLPAFVERSKGVRQKQISKHDKINILWFGGIYPWLDIRSLIVAFSSQQINENAKLSIVGGFNPFYPKEDRRFNGKYLEAVRLSKKLGLIDKSIIFRDWVTYEERIKIFNSADIAISINNNSIENEYSFRIRIADLVGNGLPIITNGGDPLGESLIDLGVAFRIDLKSSKSIVSSLSKILCDDKLINKAKELLMTRELSDKLHIYYYVEDLAKVISDGSRPRLTKGRRPIVPLKSAEKPASPQSDLGSIENASTMKLIRITSARLKKSVKVRIERLPGARHKLL